MTGCQCDNKTNGLPSNSWGESFLEINIVDLFVAMYNNACLIQGIPSRPGFYLNIHRAEMGRRPEGKMTSSHVSFFTID
jgi:hypothetical protein